MRYPLAVNLRRYARAVPRACVVVALILTTVVSATEPGWTPRLVDRVTDLADVLSAEDEQRLAGILERYEKETLHQIAILTIPTLAGESIEAFSLRVANKWGLGHKGIDDGILVTLALQERRIRIELGRGMERFITDAAAQSIIDVSMRPAFRSGDYAGGFQAALEELMRQGRRFVVTQDDIAKAKQQ